MADTILLPMPRYMDIQPGQISLSNDALIVISNAALFYEAQRAQHALLDYAGLSWPIVAGTGYTYAGLTLVLDPSFKHPQGYRMIIRETDILIYGADHAGVFYGVSTFLQLLQQHGSHLPILEIRDWPDYLTRGVMLDISRDKVPKLETVLDLVDRLAGWKINQLQLYMEHSFAYQNHPEVWANASPLIGEEILQLDIYCRQRHVDLVPNQNSLGHMERWLKLDQYVSLAECPEGFEPEWGGPWLSPSTLNPVDPASIKLVASLFDELVMHFTSPLLNVGGDEPWEFGKGKSRSQVEERGLGRIYLEYLLKLYDLVKSHHKRMMFWGDIILQYPWLIPEMPRDAIVLEWGYEADYPFDERAAVLARSGLSFYVCPGTSSWNAIAGRTDNAVKNLRSAAQGGLKHGAIGFLITDWGDNGHWQPLPVSFLGFAYGAALSWNCDANLDLDIPRALDQFVFEDAAGIMGKLAYDLGNVYQLPGLARPNGTVLHDILQDSLVEARTPLDKRVENGEPNFTADTLRNAITRIDEIMQPLDRADMRRVDDALIQREFQQAADLLRHACHRGLLLLGEPDWTTQQLLDDLEKLILRQRENWLARNRHGGLEDSIRLFDPALEDYRDV